MKRNLFKLVLAGVLLTAASGQAALVSSWNFATNGLSSLSSSRDTHVTGMNSLGVSGGTASFGVSGGVLSTSFGSGNVSTINGTVFTFIIQTSGASFSGFSASYDVDFKKITGVTGTWAYQVDDLGFNPLGSVAVDAELNNNSFTGVALGSGNQLTLTFTLSGATANNGSGDLTFDNFTFNAGSITPVPEPTTYAAGIFGGIFAVGILGRAVRKRLKD